MDRKYERMFNREVRDSESRSQFINRSIREVRSQNRLHENKTFQSRKESNNDYYKEQVKKAIEEVN